MFLNRLNEQSSVLLYLFYAPTMPLDNHDFSDILRLVSKNALCTLFLIFHCIQSLQYNEEIEYHLFIRPIPAFCLVVSKFFEIKYDISTIRAGKTSINSVCQFRLAIFKVV